MPYEATEMDLEIIILSEVGQTEKDKYHMTSFICKILKKIMQMNLFTKQTQTFREWTNNSFPKQNFLSQHLLI